MSVATIPLVILFSYAQLLGGDAGNVSVTATAISVFLIVTVPVLIGLAVRRLAESFALRLEPVARRVSGGLFVLVLAGAIVQERSNIVDYFAQAGLVTLVLNVAMMVPGVSACESVCVRAAPEDRDLDRVRVAERYAGHRGGGANIRRRAGCRTSGDLQSDNVCDGADFHRVFASPPGVRRGGRNP